MDPSPSFGQRLRQWRTQRACSQLELSGSAGVSTRHLSWLETGRSQPSRAMVLRLADQLDVPLRERNEWLTAAGFAPLFRERPLADPSMARTLAMVQRLLDAHEPWPALAVDRHWNLVAHNRLIPLLLAQASAALTRAPVNVLRLSLHPHGLAPLVMDLPRWRAYVLRRLFRQHAQTRDPQLAALREELRQLPGSANAHGDAAAVVNRNGENGANHAGAGHDADHHADADHDATDDLTTSLGLRTPVGEVQLITTVTLFGAPRDVTMSELAIETLLPADEISADRLRELHAMTLQHPLNAKAAS